MSTPKLYNEANAAYFNGALPRFGTQSSTLVSASHYLNSAAMREITAQEMLRRNGPDISPTAFIAESAMILGGLEDWPGLFALFEAEKARLPALRAFCEDPRTIPTSPDELKGAAPGTLRERLHQFLQMGFDFNFGRGDAEPGSEIERFQRKRMHAHDVEHMITGFPTDSAGEVALATANTRAFYAYFVPEFAAWLDRLANFLGAARMMRSNLYYPGVVQVHNDALDIGAAQGRSWKLPLFLVPFADLLDWQVQDIREEYGITGAPADGIWTWTIAAYEDPRVDGAEPPVS
ncbi:hypothetical protein ACFOD9_05410 [Novosphingobium bradum]|uniref:Ubiquinone biosynthesis protein Coq4 n=1 Tax=Novosphingobium bradum TaxID=1737444 RepID=A0ABV7IPX8_9SPHN